MHVCCGLLYVHTFFLQHEGGLWHDFKKYNFEDKDMDFIKEHIAWPQECAGNKVGFVAFDIIN